MSGSLVIGGIERAGITVYDVTVDVGRDDISAQPDGSVLNAKLKGYVTGEIGDTVTLTDADGVLFRGYVTDLKAELRVVDAEVSPAIMEWQTALVATGPLAALGHADAGSVDYPSEQDTDRIKRILDEAGVSHSVTGGGIGPMLLARPAEIGNAAELARKAADDGRGVLWENPATEPSVQYTPADERVWIGEYKLSWAEIQPFAWSAVDPSLTWLEADELPATKPPPGLQLDAGHVLADATFDKGIGEVIRTVIVEYGEAPEPVEGQDEQPRPSATVGDKPPSETFDTDLTTQSDAEAYADNLYRRHRYPAWRLSDIRVELMRLTPAERTVIRNALQVGAPITVAFPLGSPVGAQWQGFIEGWRHELQPGAHLLILTTSERSLTEPAATWAEAGTATWASLDPGLRWFQAVDIG